MQRTLRTSALLIAAALLMTGCSTTIPDVADPLPTSTAGSETPAPTAEPSTPPTIEPTEEPVDPGGSDDEAGVTPASGPRIQGTGYSFAAPNGWSVEGEIGASFLDVIVMAPIDPNGFTQNLNVVISPAGLVPIDLIEGAIVSELETVDAKDVTVHDRLRLSGRDFVHISAQMSVQGVSYVADQFAVNSPSQTYLVTLSSVTSTTEAERLALAKSILITLAFG